MARLLDSRRETRRNAGDVVRVAFSDAADTATAVRSVLDELRATEAVQTFVFYAPTHDAGIVADVLDTVVGPRAIAGSTAGELSERGFTDDAVTGIAFHGGHVRVATTVMPRLRELSLVPITQIADDLAERMGRDVDDLDPERHLWMLLVDGLSGQEDLLTSFFARHSGRIPLVGGSLADGDRFERATLVHDGDVYEDAGAVILLEYRRPFELIHHTHMQLTDHTFTATRVSEGGRVVEELDGRPASHPYAEALGIHPDEITIDVTGFHPLGRRFRGRPFPCSIMQPLVDGSFQMANSIQHGEQLHLLGPVDMVEQSRQAIAEVRARLEARGTKPQATLLFHCLGRYIEAEAHDLLEPLFEAMHQTPLCGLNTYGEQFGSMHMNHSLTGIMFG